MEESCPFDLRLLCTELSIGQPYNPLEVVSLRARQHRRETLLTTDMVLGGTKKAKISSPETAPAKLRAARSRLLPTPVFSSTETLCYCRASIQSRASQHRELLQRRNVAACSTRSCRRVAATRAAPQQPVQRRSNTSCSDAAPQRCALQRCCELQRHSRSL